MNITSRAGCAPVGAADADAARLRAAAPQTPVAIAAQPSVSNAAALPEPTGDRVSPAPAAGRPGREANQDWPDVVAAKGVVLDMIEHQVRIALDLGLGDHLVDRLAPLLPRIVAPTPVEAEADAKAVPVVALPDRMTLTQVLTALKRVETFRLTGPQHQAIALLKTWVLQAIEAQAPTQDAASLPLEPRP